MKKRWLSAALCTAMVAGSLAGCGLKSPDTATTAAATEAAKEEATTAADAKEETKEEAKAEAGEPVGPAVTLVMAEVNPLDTIVGQTDSAFKEKVEELSGGSITVDLQASGVLGSENDVLDTMLGPVPVSGSYLRWIVPPVTGRSSISVVYSTVIDFI